MDTKVNTIYEKLVANEDVSSDLEHFEELAESSPMEALCIIYELDFFHYQKIRDITNIATSSKAIGNITKENSQLDIGSSSKLGGYILLHSIEHKYQSLALAILEKEKPEVTENILIELLKSELFKIVDNVMHRAYPLSSGLKNAVSSAFNDSNNIASLCKLMIDNKLEDIVILKFITYYRSIVNSSIVEILLIGKKEKIAEKLLRYKKVYSDQLLAVAISTQNHKFCLLFLKMFESTISDTSAICKSILEQLKSKQPFLEFYIYVWNKIAARTGLEDDKELLEFLEQEIQSTELKFIYNHPNPIKIGILMSELLQYIENNKKSIHFKAKTLKEDVISITARLQDSIDDEQELSLLYHDKDIDHRSVISIIQSDMYLPLCENKNFEKIVSELWNGPYTTEGSLSKSTSHLRVLLGNGVMSKKDDERDGRKLYRQKNVESLPLHSYQFVTWSKGFNYQFLASMIMEAVLFFFSFIESMFTLSKSRTGINKENAATMYMNYATAENATNSSTMAQESVLLAVSSYNNSTTNAYWAMISVATRVPLFAHYIWLILYMLISKQPIKRTLEHSAIELVVCGYCVFVAAYLLPKFDIVLDEEVASIKAQNFGLFVKNTKFEIIMAVTIVVLVMKLLLNLKTNKLIGPFLKILVIILRSLAAILVFYISILIIFATALYIIEYVNPNNEFKSLYRICLILFMASVNGFNYNLFNTSLTGNILYTIFIIINSIVIMNMMIGTIGSIYDKMSKKSNNLSTIEILKMQSIYYYNPNYSSVCSLPPLINCILGIIPLLLLACIPQRHKAKVNEILLYMEYAIMFIPLLLIYVAIEVAMLLLVYPAKVFHKFLLLFMGVGVRKGKRFLYFIEWLFLGPFFVALYLFVDVGYFCKHSFSTNFHELNEATDNDYFDKKLIQRFCNELHSLPEKVPLQKVINLVQNMGITQFKVPLKRVSVKDVTKLINFDEVKVVPSPKNINEANINPLNPSDESVQSVKNYVMLCKLVFNFKEKKSRDMHIVNTVDLYNILTCHYEIEELKVCCEKLTKKNKSSFAKSSSSLDPSTIMHSKKDKFQDYEKEEFYNNNVNMKIVNVYVLKNYMLSSIEWDYDQNKCRYLDESTQMHQKLEITSAKIYSELSERKGLSQLDSASSTSRISDDNLSVRKSLNKEKLL